MDRPRPEAAKSVVAWFYESPKSAFRALLALQEIERTRGLKSVGVVDATVMSQEPNGKVRIDRTIEFSEGGAGRLGTIFPPSILVRRAVGGSDQDVSEHFSALGFQVNVLREIGENLPQDGAALVVLLREEWLNELTGVLGEIPGDEADIQRWALEVEAPPT